MIVDLHQRYGDRAVRDKRQLAGSHLIHNNAERIDITARIYLLTARLLRTDVIDRTYRLVGHGNRFCVRQLGYAEVGDLYLAVFQQHYILRLYIAVYNPF